MEDLLKDLITEAIDGKIKIKERCYNIGFNTNIVNDNQVHSFKGDDKNYLLFPTLQINNLNIFTSYLCEYIEQAKLFYKDEIDTTYGDYSEAEVSKLLMSLIWSNATTTDFNNPIEYLKRRINFLNDRRMNDYFEKKSTDGILLFSDSLLLYNVRKSPLILEAPYVLEARLESDDFMEDNYQLPRIFF